MKGMGEGQPSHCVVLTNICEQVLLITSQQLCDHEGIALTTQIQWQTFETGFHFTNESSSLFLSQNLEKVSSGGGRPQFELTPKGSQARPIPGSTKVTQDKLVIPTGDSSKSFIFSGSVETNKQSYLLGFFSLLSMRQLDSKVLCIFLIIGFFPHSKRFQF